MSIFLIFIWIGIRCFDFWVPTDWNYFRCKNCREANYWEFHLVFIYITFTWKSNLFSLIRNKKCIWSNEEAIPFLTILYSIVILKTIPKPKPFQQDRWLESFTHLANIFPILLQSLLLSLAKLSDLSNTPYFVSA